MKAEIISIGSELVTGQNLDTNCQWLSRRLAEMGIAVGWHVTLPDDLVMNVAAFRVASQRAGLVLITGGLGPTQDDLTRQALAEFAGAPLVLHEPSLAHVEAMFARRNRVMPAANRVQAMIPQGGEVLANPIGTAPGIWLTVGDCVFVAMPGVPTEMFAMFQNEVLPRLRAWAGSTGVLVERKLNCFGLGESGVEEKVRDLTRRGHVPEVGITVSDAVISLRIVAHAADHAAAEQLIAPVERTIRERLGDLVFGVGDEELQDAAARLLAERGRSVSVAESVTGGLICHRLALVPGMSEHLRGGIVAYTEFAKVQVLGVPEGIIREHGVISAEVAEAMARACRERFQTDYALGTTGLAGPGDGGTGKPVGLTYAAIAGPDGVRNVGFNWVGTRSEIQSRAAKTALNLLRLALLRERTEAD